MQMNELRAVFKAQPFQPFVLYLADGRNVRVEHPDFMAISPVGRTAVVYDKSGGFEIIDLLLVTSVQVANGRSRGKRKA